MLEPAMLERVYVYDVVVELVALEVQVQSGRKRCMGVGWYIKAVSR